jgi:hypothetical protein
VVIGDGGEMANLKAQAANSGVEKHLFWLAIR